MWPSKDADPELRHSNSFMNITFYNQCVIIKVQVCVKQAIFRLSCRGDFGNILRNFLFFFICIMSSFELTVIHS